MMKLAVKKALGEIPGSGYHYLLMPKRMENEQEHQLWAAMGFLIIEVDEKKGMELIEDACAALRHQIEIAFLTEEQNSDTI